MKVVTSKRRKNVVTHTIRVMELGKNQPFVANHSRATKSIHFRSRLTKICKVIDKESRKDNLGT